jgi:deazaflavin-dependent oxidoreductase (nitroreductase family)
VPDPNDWNASVIREFRENEGRVGGPFEGRPMLLLVTTGARSGAPRTNPMTYLDIDGRLFVFASKGGAPTNPDWYHNLVANPRVTVEQGTPEGIRIFEADAVPLEGEERDRVYAEQVQRWAQFGEYEIKTKGVRTIPVVELRMRS